MIKYTVPAILVLLQISFLLHIQFVFQYILKRQQKYLTGFINTAISNIFLAGGLTVLAVYKPILIQEVDVGQLLWLMAGIMMLAMIVTQAMIFRAIYRRSKEPEHFHYNYFGSKVLHSTVLKQEEIAIFFFTMPFLLFCGAYFIARLINLIMYGRL